jgi:predicted dehydrogenase
MTIRVGVIGTGIGGSLHIPAFQRHPAFEVVGVVSKRRERAEEAARAAGVSWFSDDYRRLLQEVELDLVSITPNAPLHKEMVLAAAEARRDVLCEKPLATSLSEAEEMLAAVRQAGIRHFVNHQFRMVPARNKLNQLVKEGVLGEVWDVQIHNDMGMQLSPGRPWSWWSDRAQYGGIMQAITSHWIDFLLWTFGDIVSVAALVDTFIKQRPDADGAVRQVTSDDQNAVVLRFASGAAGLLHVSGIARFARSTVVAQGSRGGLLIDGNALLRAREPNTTEPVELAPLPGANDPGVDGRVPLMVSYLDHLERALNGEVDDVAVPFEQGLRVQAVMDAMHASADASGSRVEVPVGRWG